jgi:hypothetical protein
MIRCWCEDTTGRGCIEPAGIIYPENLSGKQPVKCPEGQKRMWKKAWPQGIPTIFIRNGDIMIKRMVKRTVIVKIYPGVIQ